LFPCPAGAAGLSSAALTMTAAAKISQALGAGRM
jgi:hypothetical protein